MSCTRVVIVGAGQAGGRTAQALRRLGHTGAITLLGEEPEAPYERPALSKDLLLGRIQAESLQLLSPDKWQVLGVELRCGVRVNEIDREANAVLLDDGTRLGYDALVLATGARPRPYPKQVDTGTELLQLRDLRDTARLRPRLQPGHRLAVIGAGFIGMELAASARELGADVTLIEAARRPLARILPAGVADWLVDLHRARGVTVHLDCHVQHAIPGQLLCTEGRTVATDTIVVGIGAVPNDELAAAAGLDVRDGVLVDDCGRSSDAAIFAVGDVARHSALDQRLESWRNAEDTAVNVAAAICGAPAPRLTVPWFWTDQYGHNIQLAGRPEDAHQRVDIGDPAVGPWLSYFLDGGGVVRGALAVDCGREMRGAMKLIEAGVPVAPAELPRLRERAPAATLPTVP